MERRLAQLSQALEEAQALQEQYAQQLADANAANKQRVGNIEAAGQARLQALQLPPAAAGAATAVAVVLWSLGVADTAKQGASA
ncbi:hypothetical protein OEZ86_002960 [Tetradesmus obliquus]|nr:hypothetical protein OEZ86_002960 [Tetradesmus obliquus]